MFLAGGVQTKGQSGRLGLGDRFGGGHWLEI